MGGSAGSSRRFSTVPSHPFLEETYQTHIRTLVNLMAEMILAKYTRRIWQAGGQRFGTLLESEPGEATTDAAQTPGSGVWERW